MSSIIFNTRGRLRCGWRATIFLVAYLIISAFLIVASYLVVSRIGLDDTAQSFWPLTIPFTLSAATAIILALVFGKFLEGLEPSALGLSLTTKSLVDTSLGLLVGAFAIATAVVIAWGAGGLIVERNLAATTSQISSTLAFTFIIFSIGALSEEALFRGYLLQTFVRDRVVVVGTVLTSLLFALAHNQNPAIGRLSLINTFIAGIWFAVGYLKTRNLWFPLGMHLMWNWLQGPVFGINVSGISDLNSHSVLRTTDAGPEWLTGGAYGIEGGAACTIALALFVAIVKFCPDWMNRESPAFGLESKRSMPPVS